MITFISSTPRVFISGLARIGYFFQNLGRAIIEVEKNRAKLETEVFCRYNRIVSTGESNHALRAEEIRWKY